MHCALSDDQLTIQRTARELLADRMKPEHRRRLLEAGESDDALWRELGELGWPGIALAEADGGAGLGLVELSVLCEALGAALAPVPFLPTVAAALLIDDAGSDAQRARWLSGLAAGELRGAVALVDGDRPALIAGAPGADVLVLVAGGAARVVAAREAPPLDPVDTIDRSRGWAQVGADAVGAAGESLGDAGAAAAGLERAAIAVAAEQVGVAQRALDFGVEYAKEREQFGRPIGVFQAVSHTLADLLLAVENARSLVLYAAWTDAGEPAARPLAAAMAKAAADDAALQATRRALQVLGGIGFTWEHDLHFFFKRAHANTQLFGTAASHELRVAELIGL